MHQVSLQVSDFLFDVVCNVLVLCFYMFDVHVVLVQNVVESSIALTEWTMACVICGDSIDLHKSSEYVTLTEKGCVGINKASHDRNLDIPDRIFTDHCNIIVNLSKLSKNA